MILHEEACPALMKCCAAKYRTDAWRGVSCSGEGHDCDCNPPTAAQLKELVEAAEEHYQETTQHGAWVITDEEKRLDAALRPFRETAGEEGQ